MLPPSRPLPLATIPSADTIPSAERCESLLLDIVGFVHHFPGHYSSEAPLTHRCPRRTGLMTVPAESGCLSPHAAPIPRAAPHGG